MSRKTIYFHHGFLFFALLLFLAVTVVGLVFFGVVGLAFANVGFSPILVMLILAASLFGSAINIPVWKVKTTVPMIKDEYASFFGVTYRIPRVEYGETVTTVAVNVGGALIPAAVSIYLLSRAEIVIALYSIIGVAAVALVTYALARPVKGVGIVTPALIPPIAAALIAIILSPHNP